VRPLIVLFVAFLASACALAADPQPGRAYLMKGALIGGPEPFDDIVTSFAFGARLGERFSADLVYKNEGHGDDGHRDGFGAQLFYRLPFSSRFSAEAGAGVLWTFNTVRRDGIEVNEKDTAALLSAALVYRLKRTFSLRAQYDLVHAPGSFRTQTVLLGIQSDFERREAAPLGGAEVEVTALVGVSMMNTSAARAGLAYQAELRRPFGRDLACSASVLREEDNRVANRTSVAAQCWYVKQLSPRWRMSAGVGPLAAVDHSDGDTTRLGALISVELAKHVRDSVALGARFSRLAVPTHPARDADLFMLFARAVF